MLDSNTRKLIKLYRSTGSKKALEVLLLNHQNSIHFSINKTPRILERFEREDLISFGNDILLKAIDEFDLRRKIKFNTYFIQILKFRFIDELRKLKTTIEYEDYFDEPQQEENPFSFEDEELKILLIDSISTLPRTQQIVMGMIYQGTKHKDIAQQCGVSSSRISIIYQSALKNLKNKLSGVINDRMD